MFIQSFVSSKNKLVFYKNNLDHSLRKLKGILGLQVASSRTAEFALKRLAATLFAVYLPQLNRQPSEETLPQ